jgi:uncharacterized membrane protein
MTRFLLPLRTTAALLLLSLMMMMAAGQAAAVAGGIEVIPIASLGLGVSGDGAIVVGGLDNGAELLVSRWTEEGGVQTLGQGVATDISRDGTTLVGDRMRGSFRWTMQQGYLELGNLSGGNRSTNALDLSGDGAIVIGLAHQSTGFRGFRWTESTGMVALGDLPGGFNFSQANSISADGQTIVGVSTGSSGDRAVRWIGADPTPLTMGLPPGLTGFTEAKGVSGDGNVVVGVWGDGDSSNEAFRWTALGGYELLGDLPGGLLDSVATQTNDDGSVVVGTGNAGDDVPDEAFYWTENAGLRSLRDVLSDAGADLSAWQTLDVPTSLSDDGNVIVGTGTLTDGTVVGFRARLIVPEPSGGVLLMVATVVVSCHRKGFRRRSLSRRNHQRD